jgi:hypothetical protein
LSIGFESTVIFQYLYQDVVRSFALSKLLFLRELIAGHLFC